MARFAHSPDWSGLWFKLVEEVSGEFAGGRFGKRSPGTDEIAWTFLPRAYWDGKYNAEMKALMLRHAFTFVDRVIFLIGPENYRSQSAVEKIGAVPAGTRIDGYGKERLAFDITAAMFDRNRNRRKLTT